MKERKSPLNDVKGEKRETSSDIGLGWSGWKKARRMTCQTEKSGYFLNKGGKSHL
jgi:hypothetical protein